MSPSSFRTLALAALLMIVAGSLPAQEISEDAASLVDETGGDESGGDQPVEPSPENTQPEGEMSVVSVVASRVKLGRAFYMEERREDVAVENILDSEAIARAGDSNAATALKRVTGVTVAGGRFIYVRGLGERYSSTLLNGATIPSPDPVRRVVPLDLFPTGIVESIVVQKSYTQNLPAEFGGGAVELRTRSVPRKNFFEAEIKLGYNDGTTGEDGLRYNGGAQTGLAMTMALATSQTCSPRRRPTGPRSRNSIDSPVRATLRRSLKKSVTRWRTTTTCTRRT
jgi:hypothetical protein